MDSEPALLGWPSPFAPQLLLETLLQFDVQNYEATVVIELQDGTPWIRGLLIVTTRFCH
jgi:hypothetical protein